MRLNHLNLSVTDVKATRAFFETYLGLKAVNGVRPEDTFIAMTDESNFVITLMENKQAAYPKSFHIGFLKQGVEQVQALYEQLKKDNYAVEPPRAYRGTGLDLYVNTPFGFTLQVSA